MKTLTCHWIKCALFVLLLSWASQPLTVAGQSPMPEQGVQTERSTVLTLTVNGVSRQLSVADLAAMPQARVNVRNGHTNQDEVYTGVALSDLLSANGLPFTKDTQRTYLRSYLRAQGTDFYFAIYSASEVIPALNTSSVIVATHVNGRELGRDGLFKLVGTGDKQPARWVRNLISITLVTVN